MKYITGVFALNINDNLETCGDWHTSALDWSNITLVDSETTKFRDYGIEKNKEIPEHTEKYNVANTLRAVLDLMIDKKTRFLKGFRNDFFCTDLYNKEFFSKVIQLKDLDNWNDINNLMKHEFMYEWDNYINNKSADTAKYSEESHTKLIESLNQKYSNNAEEKFSLAITQFANTNQLSDLYEIIFVYSNYKQYLSDYSIKYLSITLEYIGLEYIKYIIENQPSNSIGTNQLKETITKIYSELGLD
jgi:hypothetical protein